MARLLGFCADLASVWPVVLAQCAILVSGAYVLLVALDLWNLPTHWWAETAFRWVIVIGWGAAPLLVLALMIVGLVRR